MATLALEPKIPKGTILNPGRRQIMAFIRDVGSATPKELYDRFRNVALTDGKGAIAWVDAHMHELRRAGHVERDDGVDEVLWCLAGDRGPDDEDEEELENVATPRRVSMFGPVYAPAPGNQRAGSGDYARHPSIVNGRPQPFRGGR